MCQTPHNPMDWRPARLLCPWDFPGKDTGLGCHFLFQGIFPTQGSNVGLLHCRQILYLYRLSHQGSPLRGLTWNVSFISNSCKREILVLSDIPLSWVSLLWITTLSNVIWNNLTCPKIQGGASGKEPTCQWRRPKRSDPALIPGSGRSPGGGHGNLLQYSYMKNPMDRRVWPATVHRVAKSRTQLKQLSTHTKYWSCFWFLSLRKWVGGNSLVAQWLALEFPLLRAWVPSLVRELGSHKFCSDKKKNKTETNKKWVGNLLSLKFKNQNS